LDPSTFFHSQNYESRRPEVGLGKVEFSPYIFDKSTDKQRQKLQDFFKERPDTVSEEKTSKQMGDEVADWMDQMASWSAPQAL
jgi:hypothetical protein